MSVVEFFPKALPKSGHEKTREEGSGEGNFGTMVVMLEGNVVERHALTRPRMLIGRGANADLRLNSHFVSVNHSMLVREDAAVYVVDLHSTNKTIVNGKAVRKKMLRHGDVVSLGEFTLRYESAPLSLFMNGRQTPLDSCTNALKDTYFKNGELADAYINAKAGEPADSQTTPALRQPVVISAVGSFPTPMPDAQETMRAPTEALESAATFERDASDGTTVVVGAAGSTQQKNNDKNNEEEPSAASAAEPGLVDRAQRDKAAVAPNARPEIPAESPSAMASSAPPAVHIGDFADGSSEALDDAALAAAVAEGAREGRSALEVLESTSGLDATTLAAELARIFAYRHLQARDLMALKADFEVLPAAEARRRGCVVALDAGRLTAVIADPFDADLRPWLEAHVSSPLAWALTARGDLNAFIARYEQGARAIDTALKGAHGELSKDNDLEELSLASISADSSPVVKLVRSTLYDALRANASDVHLEAGNAQLEIRYRIDGVLVQIASVPGSEIAEQVISRVKVMSELDIAERRVPQDGRFKSSFNGRAIDFRVSIMPSSYGEDAVLRVLDKQAITDQMSELRIDGLGFEPDVIDALRHLSALPHGMLLVTGPTGSGKTTTLYAAISETNTGLGKIVTIEDPVEYQLPGVLQIPVNEKKGLTFARGLRSILRHDPDKIMVGEIRDPETAQIAVQSALTGHLVFTTVHANNVFDVLSRFTHMGVDVYSFVAALNGILAQRLVRIVCEHCSEPVMASADMLAATGLALEQAQRFNWHAGRGCSHCRGTGYRGRRAVGELLVLNDELREAIVARVPVRQLKELASKNHVRLIRTVALDLVRDGLTTIEEVNRVTAVS